MRLTRWIIDTSSQAIGLLRSSRRISFRHRSEKIKVNLGCGLAVAKGWINVDGSLNALFASWPTFIHRVLFRISGANRYYSCEEYCSLLGDHDFVHHDLSYGIPLPDGTADFIYSSHFLEHLYKPDAEKLLADCFRVLKSDGVLRICVPDLAYAISLYSAGEKETMLNNYFFVEDMESHFARHKYMYDFELLCSILGRLGFKDIERCAYRQGVTPDLTVLDNRPEETLFVEAKKPLPI